jgi:preprotein translocase subunit YajC
MLPNRADYKNKKDYKWARKQAQREELSNGTGIASARGWASFVTFFALGLGFQALGFEGWGTALALIVAIFVFSKVPPAPIIQEQRDAKKREEQARGPKWKKGTRVVTASGRKGTVKMAVANRPNYFHVKFDDGLTEQMKQSGHDEIEKQRARLKEEEAGAPAVAPQEPEATPQVVSTSIPAELQRLTDLHQAGSLTADEFETAKAKVLAS